MESKVEAIKEAIKQLMIEEEEELNETNNNNSNNLSLLSKLMSQLENLEGESKTIGNDSIILQQQEDEDEDDNEKQEEIVKELKKVRRQNVITHCLLSVMIVLTVVWQISEVSIILKLKDGVTHPFRSVGSMLKRIILKPKPNAVDDDDQTSSSFTSNLIDQSTSMVHDLDLKLPHLDLPKITFNNDAHKHSS